MFVADEIVYMYKNHVLWQASTDLLRISFSKIPFSACEDKWSGLMLKLTIKEYHYYNSLARRLNLQVAVRVVNLR